MWLELNEGANLFSDLWNADIPRICVENPVMHKYAKERIINYVEPPNRCSRGSSVTVSASAPASGSRTCRRSCRRTSSRAATQRVHMASPGPDRWKERSRFYPGIAKAMAEQWGGVIANDYPQAA
jgi:hypothetical protein